MSPDILEFDDDDLGRPLKVIDIDGWTNEGVLALDYKREYAVRDEDGVDHRCAFIVDVTWLDEDD